MTFTVSIDVAAPGPFDARPVEHVEELDTCGLVIPSAGLAV